MVTNRPSVADLPRPKGVQAWRPDTIAGAINGVSTKLQALWMAPSLLRTAFTSSECDSRFRWLAGAAHQPGTGPMECNRAIGVHLLRIWLAICRPVVLHTLLA